MNISDQATHAVRPAISKSVDESAAVLRFALPGVAQADIVLRAEGRSISISTKEEASAAYAVTVPFPAKYDLEKASADHALGVLTLTVPVAESAAPRDIAIAS